jgi:hypothetical protein
VSSSGFVFGDAYEFPFEEEFEDDFGDPFASGGSARDDFSFSDDFAFSNKVAASPGSQYYQYIPEEIRVKTKGGGPKLLPMVAAVLVLLLLNAAALMALMAI